jgi:hypothetical protein
MTAPRLFDLRNDPDAARFNLTPAERDKFLTGCFRNRSGARPRAIFCHVQEGTTSGSLDWSINKSGSQNSYTVTAQQDGSILRCIPEEHGPWTNGAVRKPKPAAKKLLDLGGNPNIYTLSIEAEGTFNGPHSNVQIDAIYWQIRQWQAKYRIPNAWVFEHADVDTVQRANCAGWYYDQIRARLDADGEAGSTPDTVPVQPEPVSPSPIAVLTAVQQGAIAPATVRDPESGVTFFWVGDRVRAIRDTPRFRFADETQKLGTGIKAGEEFDVDFLFAFGDSGQLWYYTPAATRVKAEDTERISDRKAA